MNHRVDNFVKSSEIRFLKGFSIEILEESRRNLLGRFRMLFLGIAAEIIEEFSGTIVGKKIQ